jgi:hypothetical protein
MKSQTYTRLISFIFSIVFYSSSLLAFSSSPEETPYTVADWENSLSAEDDAKIAIEHQDLRLLGFAGKGYDIPGINAANQQRYIDSCGLRLFEEFGDVVSNRKQLEKMQQARDYARQYNRIILTACPIVIAP